MKVVVISLGSRGDCVPYLVVAKELERRGHQVRLLINDSKDQFVPRSEIPNIEKLPLAGDYDELVGDDIVVQMMRNDDMGKFFEMFSTVMERLFPDHTRQIYEACEGMDMIVVNPNMKDVTVSVAEKLRLPIVNLCLQPQIRTSDEPHPMVSPTPYPFKWLNRLTWSFVFRLDYNSNVTKLVNPWRIETLGLPAIPGGRSGCVHLYERHPLPNICAFSPELVPPCRTEARGDAAGIVTGYPFSYKEDEAVAQTFTPTPELESFLSSGPKPVYLGWGSMNAGHPEKTSELVYRALHISGARAVIYRGHNGISIDSLDRSQPDYEEVRAYAQNNSVEVDFVPHSWLFSRCAAAVFHGGSGTTHATLRAGIPAIITPFAFDQPYFQYKCYAAGVGPRAPNFFKVTSKQLGGLIKSTLADEKMIARAAEMGESMRGQEDGATLICKAVERVAANTEMWTKFYDNGGITGDDCWEEEKTTKCW